VSTAAYVGDSDGRWAVRGYNPDPATNFMTYLSQSGFEIGNGAGTGSHPVGDSGVTSCSVFSCSAGPYGGLSSTGTGDHAGTATSAFDTLMGSDANGPAAAAVSASLADGAIHASAAGSFGVVYQGQDQFSRGSAVGVLGDTLHFTIAGADASTVTSIQVEYHIDGGEVANRTAAFGSQGGFTAYTLAFGDTSIHDRSSWTPGVTGPGTDPFPQYAGQNVNGGFGAVTLANITTLSYAPEDTDFIATYNLTGASVTAPFSEWFGVGCQDGMACDFSHTSQVAFLLPRGVTYTSDSGVFLGGTAGVPEPTTWAMLILGMFGGGAVLRRRRNLSVAISKFASA
jgi:hypothetical protein